MKEKYMNDENCIVSNDLYCKEQIKAHVNNSCLKIDCDDVLSVLTHDIDVDKFIAWFDRNIDTFKTKQIIQPYFKRAFLTELKRGTFKPVEVRVDVSYLVGVMRDRGIKVTTDDPLYLEIMWEEIIKKGMPIEDVISLNHKVLDYMNDKQTFGDYVALIERSNAIKPYKVDWQKIEKEYNDELAKWTIMLNELSLEVPINET